MSNSTEIEEFLVSIGYVLGRNQWKETMDAIVERVGQIAASLLAMEALLKAVVVNTTMELDGLQFAATRTGASVSSLHASAYAVQQIRLKSSAAGGTIGAFSAKLRTLPAAEAVLQSLGIVTRENGNLRDTGVLLKEALRALQNEKDYVLAYTKAEILGIPEGMYAHFRQNLDDFEKYYGEGEELDRALGIDKNQAGKDSQFIMRTWRSAVMHLSTLAAGLMSQIGPIMLPFIKSVEAWVTDNQDDIVWACKRLITSSEMLLDALRVLINDVLLPITTSVLSVLQAFSGEGGLSTALKAIMAIGLIAMAARMLSPINLIMLAIAGLTLSLTTATAKGEAQAPPKQRGPGGGGTQPPGTSGATPSSSPSLFQRAKNWMFGDSGERSGGGGATGSWGNTGHGASGEWGSGQEFNQAVNEQSLEVLANDRLRFVHELSDPVIAARFAAFVEAEVGAQGAQAQQAFIESVLNRASARNMTMGQVLSGSYWPAITHANVARYMNNPAFLKKYAPLFQIVLGGSNISGFATGNASLDVEFGGGPRTATYGGEKFGIEKADLGWASRMKALSDATESLKTRVIQGSVTISKDPVTDVPRVVGAPPVPPLGTVPGTTTTTDFSVVQSTEITVHGDPDPTNTSNEVSSVQTKVNKNVAENAKQAAGTQ